MSNEESMEDYNMRADALCERVQDQIKEGDTLDIVMEMVTFMAATTGLQILSDNDMTKEEFLTHFVNAIVGAMDELGGQDEDKLTGGKYVQ
jgi:hypothetical protein